MKIIQAKNISKSYNSTNKKVNVLRNVNIELEQNEISVIYGASGAGKSTLLHILSGLDYPTSGMVNFNGKEIFKMGENELAKLRNTQIGFVFQFHHLLPEFTALENVAIPQLIAGTGLKRAQKNATSILNFVGLGERLLHKPGELSGGEQQRVAIARALANNPSVIFADEPTGNLDTANSNSIIDLFLELNKEKKVTIIIVTHNENFKTISNNSFRMKDGQIELI